MSESAEERAARLGRMMYASLLEKGDDDEHASAVADALETSMVEGARSMARMEAAGKRLADARVEFELRPTRASYDAVDLATREWHAAKLGRWLGGGGGDPR